MIEIPLTFSIEDGVKLLRAHGFDVRFQPMTFHFERDHGDGYDTEIEVWVVINPYTGKPVPVERFLREFLMKKAKTLFLEADKLDLISLFQKIN